MSTIIKYFLLGYLSLGLLTHGFAQNHRVDSLKNQINTSKKPAEVSSAYFNLGEYYRLKEHSKTKAAYYYDEAIRYAKENNLTGQYALYHSYRADVETDIAKKKYFFKKYLVLVDTIKKPIPYATVLGRMSRLYASQSQWDSAEYYTYRSLDVKKNAVKNHPDSAFYKQSLGHGYNLLSSIMLNQSKYQEAMEAIYNALNIFTELNDTNSMAASYLNLGVIHYYHNDTVSALKSYQKAYSLSQNNEWRYKKASALNNMGTIYLQMKEYDIADSLYREALEIRLEIGPKSIIAGIYDNLGIIAKNKKKYVLALEYYQKAQAIHKENNDINKLSGVHNNLGNLYLIQKNYAKAEENLTLAYSYAIQVKNYESQIQLLKNLSKLYSEKGDFQKAYKIQVRYKALDDSLHSIESQTIIRTLQEKFDTAEKDRTISEFKQRQKLAELIQEQQRLNNRMLAGGIIAVIIISILIIFWINQRRKTEKQLYQHQKELDQQKMLDLVKEQEMSSVNAFIHGQEKERSRIASDLHDRLGSLLSTVKLHFSSLEPYFEDNKEISESFAFAISLLDQSVSEVRTVSHNLAKEILTEFGLEGAIANLSEAINSAGVLKFVFIPPQEKVRFPYDIEIEIYRILQELVTNTIKHANAQELVVQFIIQDNQLSFTVEDDGVGFDINKIESNGMGLSNIFDRVKKINGKYSIDSSPNDGSSFFFDIPLKQD